MSTLFESALEEYWTALNGQFASALRELIKILAAEQALQLTFADNQENVPNWLVIPQIQTYTFDPKNVPIPELGCVRLVRRMPRASRVPVWYFGCRLDIANLVDIADCQTRFKNCARAIVSHLQMIQGDLQCPGMLIWVNFTTRIWIEPHLLQIVITSFVPVGTDGLPLVDSVINA